MPERTYSQFEIEMSRIFFRLYGGTTALIENQSYWSYILQLKTLAQKEVVPCHCCRESECLDGCRCKGAKNVGDAD